MVLFCHGWEASGGGALPLNMVQVCAVVMTLFLQASRHSLAYQFPINAPLTCPPFSNFRKICIFSVIFGQNFSSQDVKLPKFCFQDSSFFKENPLPRPYFWKPAWHIPTKKKVECPPPKHGSMHLPSMCSMHLIFVTVHHKLLVKSTKGILHYMQTCDRKFHEMYTLW